MKDRLSSNPYWPLFEGMGVQTALGAPWLVLFPQRAHARLTVVTATLFAREHALREKLLRHCYAPR